MEMTTPHQLDFDHQRGLERIRERNRIAKRRSRARQRQMQNDAGGAGGDDQAQIIKPTAGNFSIEHAPSLELRSRETNDGSRGWVEFVNPGDDDDHFDDDGVPIQHAGERMRDSHSVISPSSSSTDYLSSLTQFGHTDSPTWFAHDNDPSLGCSQAIGISRTLPTNATAAAFDADFLSQGLVQNINSRIVTPTLSPADTWDDSLLSHVVKPSPSGSKTDGGGTSSGVLNGRPNVNSKSASGMLHLAVRNGSRAIAERLLMAGSSVNSRDSSGALPLHVAVRHRRQSIAQLLMGYGADPNALDSTGMTPLELAVRIRDENMVDMLISGGADVL